MTNLDRWHCRYGCGYKHPVATMVEWHEQNRCEWRWMSDDGRT